MQPRWIWTVVLSTAILSSKAFGAPVDTIDSLNLIRLQQVAMSYLATNLDSTRYFAHQIDSLARIEHLPWAQARATFLLGKAEHKEGAYASALAYYSQSRLLLQKQSEREADFLCDVLIASGIACQKLGDYQKAFTYYMDALSAANQSANDSKLAEIYNSIGSVYGYLNNYSQKIAFSKKALLINQEIDDQPGIAQSFTYLGNAYLKLEAYDSAKYFLNKALDIYQSLAYLRHVATLYMNLGIIQEKLANYDSALYLYDTAKDLQTQLGDEESLVWTLNNIGFLYNRRDEFTAALAQHFKSLALAEKLNLARMKQINYENIAQNYYDLGQYRQAYNYQEKFINLKDTLLNEETTRQIAELREQYEAEKREQEITLLEKDKAVQEAILTLTTQQRNAMVIALLLTLLVASLLFYSFRQASRVKLAKARAEQDQQVHQLLKNQEVTFLDALMQGQAMERKRIATDLHNRLGSLLATIKLYYSDLASHLQLPEPQQQQLTKAGQLLDQACREVRSVAHNLAAVNESHFRLAEALRHLRDTVNESHQLRFQLFLHNFTQSLPQEIEITVYRIVQEAVSNVLRHAHAREVTLQLSLDAQHLNLIMEDDGVGFDPEHTAQGLGLKNIASRVAHLQGKLHVDARKERGTTLIVDLPLASVQESAAENYLAPQTHSDFT